VHATRGWKVRGWAVVLGLAASACVQQRPEPAAHAHVPPAPAPASQAAPRITSTFQSGFSAEPRRPITLRVVAEDPQARALIIRWSANTGTLSEPAHEAAQSEVEWTPPPCMLTGTTPTITATVTNALGLTAATTFTVTEDTACLAGNTRASGSKLLSLHSESVAWNAR